MNIIHYSEEAKFLNINKDDNGVNYICEAIPFRNDREDAFCFDKAKWFIQYCCKMRRES